MTKQSSEEYISTKLKPIFTSLTESLVTHCSGNEDPILFMIKWLQNYNGRSSVFEISTEKTELENLRREIKKYQKKFKADDEEIHAKTDESENEEEDQDQVEELIEIRKEKAKAKGNRASVSAEAYGMFNQKQAFVPKVIPKTTEQIQRIESKVLNSFLFNTLDEKELKICLDAMEEYRCQPGDYVITQNEPGSVLYIIEKGTYDCYKTFVSF